MIALLQFNFLFKIKTPILLVKKLFLSLCPPRSFKPCFSGENSRVSTLTHTALGAHSMVAGSIEETLLWNHTVIAGVHRNHLLASQDASCRQTNMFFVNDESFTPPECVSFFYHLQHFHLTSEFLLLCLDMAFMPHLNIYAVTFHVKATNFNAYFTER